MFFLKMLWWQEGFPFMFSIKEHMMCHGSLSFFFLLFLEHSEYYFCAFTVVQKRASSLLLFLIL